MKLNNLIECYYVNQNVAEQLVRFKYMTESTCEDLFIPLTIM